MPGLKNDAVPKGLFQAHQAFALRMKEEGGMLKWSVVAYVHTFLKKILGRMFLVDFSKRSVGSGRF